MIIHPPRQDPRCSSRIATNHHDAGRNLLDKFDVGCTVTHILNEDYHLSGMRIKRRKQDLLCRDHRSMHRDSATRMR